MKMSWRTVSTYWKCHDRWGLQILADRTTWEGGVQLDLNHFTIDLLYPTLRSMLRTLIVFVFSYLHMKILALLVFSSHYPSEW